MEISDRINQAQIEVIMSKNYEPKFAYLGKIEMDELLAWGQKECGHESKFKPDDGIEFLNLKCLMVNKDNHLHVA